MTFRDLVLTSIVAYDEIHIWSELERTKRIVTHEILQSDALDEADISLKIHAKGDIKQLMKGKGKKELVSHSGNYSPWRSERRCWRMLSDGSYHLVYRRYPQLSLCGS